MARTAITHVLSCASLSDSNEKDVPMISVLFFEHLENCMLFLYC